MALPFIRAARNETTCPPKSGATRLQYAGSEDCAGLAGAEPEFFDLAKSQPAPIAIEALTRIAELYDIEAEIRGRTRGTEGLSIPRDFTCLRCHLRISEPRGDETYRGR